MGSQPEIRQVVIGRTWLVGDCLVVEFQPNGERRCLHSTHSDCLNVKLVEENVPERSRYLGGDI